MPRVQALVIGDARILLAAEADLSFDEIRSVLSGALRAQFGNDTDGCSRFYIYETFPSYVIARGSDEKLYRIPYTMTGEDVKFGDAEEVETAYVPVAESCAFELDASESDATDDGTYPIVALKAGWGRGALSGQSVPHYYPPAFVARVAEAVESKPFGRRHPDQQGNDRTGANDPDRIAGYLGKGTFDGQRALTTVNLFAAESELRSKLSEARKTKTIKNFAVSMLAAVKFVPGVVDGKQCMVAQDVAEFYSLDLCARAGAGGEFIAAASFFGNDLTAQQDAAVKPNTAIKPGGTARVRKTGARMNKKLQALLEALKSKNPAKAADFYGRAVVASEADQETIEGEVIAALSEAPSATTAVAAEAATAELNRTMSRGRVETALTASKLNEPAKKLVRQHMEARLVAESNLTDEVINAEITATRDAFAAVESLGRVRQGEVSLDSRDKLALAVESMLGVKESMGKGVTPFRGLKQAYVAITGDYDLSTLNKSGFSGHVVASEAVATGDFPNLLLDAMHKLLAQEWKENDLDGLETLYQAANLDDYRTRNVVRDGYFGELPTVNEAGAYTELTKPGDEKVSYTPSKKGGLLTISEETIRNDDLGAVARWPGKLARAGRNTLRSFIVNFFASNPTYGADSLAIFHASHNNLLALPFGIDGLRTAQLGLRRQQERDSNEYLGLPLTWIAVPPELEAAAIQTNQANTAGSSDFFHRFGENNERIFIVEKFTDTNDWYYGTDTNLAPFMEIGFLDGKQQPEIFLANVPTIGTMFSNDQLQYKVKFVYGGTMTDFRGVGKSVNP